jgi:branched-chain amino acid aminotransferase
MIVDIHYVDGRFVDASEAVISVTDLAVLRGYGVFDFLRTYRKRPFHLDDHLRRLERSARLIGLGLPCPREDIAAIVAEALDQSGHPECNIRLVVTGGASGDAITPEGRPRLVVLVTALQRQPAEWYADGVKVVTEHVERFMPGAKSIHYIPGILALRRAREQGAVEALYVDAGGRVREGTTSNFFAFLGDVLVTPDAGILAGVTRQVVLDRVREVFAVEIRDLHKEELALLDEAFLTSSNKEVVPVVRIDAVGIGGPGPRTRKVMALFRDYTDAYGAGG